MKKFLTLGAILLTTLSLSACGNDDREYKMNIIEIVETTDGNHLAYCEPAKLMKLKHYVDIPELESYDEITTFIAKLGKEKTYWVLKETNKKVNNGKYEFLRWEE